MTNTKFPCGVCTKTVANNHNAICCDSCDKWVHIKCNFLNKKTYRKLQKDKSPWFCINCINDQLPFQTQVNSDPNQKYVLPNKHSSLNDLLDNLDLDDDFPTTEYYTPDEFSQLNIEKSNLFIHLNISSLSYFIDELKQLLSQMKHRPNVIAISETRIRKNKEISSKIDIPGYKYEFTETESEKGGTLLYISEELKYKNRKDLNMYQAKTLESSFIEIENKNKKNIIVGCIYKHPTMEITEFISDFMEPCLKKLSFEKKELVLLGDYNINLLNCDSDKNSGDFLELMLSFSFLPRIIKPTRITSRSKTLIDNIFINEHYSNIVAGNITTDISDHLTQFVAIPGDWHAEMQGQETYRRNYKKLNSGKFKEDFNKINWINLLTGKGVDDAYDTFLEETEKLIDKHIPLEKVSKRKLKKQIRNPWINNDLMKKIKYKDKIHKKSNIEKDLNKKNDLIFEHKTLQKNLRKEIQLEKDKYYQNFFKENKNNLVKVWRNIKNLINFKPKAGNNNIKHLYIDKEKRISSDPFEISNSFNKHFTTVASNIDKKIVKTNKNFNYFLRKPNEKTFALYPTTPAEVKSYIKNINIRKSVGPFSIPNPILKEFHEIFATPISQIFNLSLESGIFPKKMKIATVIPVYKKDDNLDCNNYRPISLLPNISKMFEKLIKDRLSKFLEENKCLFAKQFGFRNKHSTTHALIDLTETIREALDKDEFACGVFLDFKKAFDTVNHKILLKKLEHYGVRGHAVKWFSSYLAERKQYTSVNNTNSQIDDITYGVPQGSVLGPLLFLIYINDLNNAIKFSSIRHFADDTNIIYRHQSLRKINQRINFDLKNLVEWLRANRIALNTNKTEIVIFRTPRKTITRKMNFRISGQRIHPKSTVKYLGLVIDEFLHWKTHYTVLRAKLKRSIGLLAKLRYSVSSNLLRTVYFAIFDSYLRYGCQVWGQNKNAETNEISILQDKALRVISFKNRDTPVGPLFKEKYIIRFFDLIRFYNCLFVAEHLNQNLPTSFREYFTYMANRHNHNTRGAVRKLVSMPLCKTSFYGSHSVTAKSAKDWNNLQNPVAFELNYDQVNITKLISALKNYFLDSYSE